MSHATAQERRAIGLNRVVTWLVKVHWKRCLVTKKKYVWQDAKRQKDANRSNYVEVVLLRINECSKVRLGMRLGPRRSRPFSGGQPAAVTNVRGSYSAA